MKHSERTIEVEEFEKLLSNPEYEFRDKDIYSHLKNKASAVLLRNPINPWKGLGHTLWESILESDDYVQIASEVVGLEVGAYSVRVSRGMDDNSMESLKGRKDDPVSAGHWFSGNPTDSEGRTKFSLVLSTIGGKDIGYLTCSASLESRDMHSADREELERLCIFGELSDGAYEAGNDSYAATHWLMSVSIDFLFLDANFRGLNLAKKMVSTLVEIISLEVEFIREALTAHDAEASLRICANAEPHGWRGEDLSLHFLRLMTEEFGEDPEGADRLDHDFDELEEEAKSLAEGLGAESKWQILDAIGEVGRLFREARLQEKDEPPLRVRLKDAIDWE